MYTISDVLNAFPYLDLLLNFVCYSVMAVTLYHSIAKLSFLTIIAHGTEEPLSCLSDIALSKFEPLSLLKVIAQRPWHKR